MKIKRKYGMPVWANFISRDADGRVWVYEEKPVWNKGCNYFDHEGKGLGGRASEIRWPVAAPSVGQCFQIV